MGIVCLVMEVYFYVWFYFIFFIFIVIFIMFNFFIVIIVDIMQIMYQSDYEEDCDYIEEVVYVDIDVLGCELSMLREEIVLLCQDLKQCF